ncbi:MAG: cytochrome c peroxidase [Sulfurimonas sp.]|nr:cytochrome c peroxidase [Sulfurimonas sp.]MDQ7059931.1 cytochrome c peroxidase [Sulfurimonas sp.]
MIKKVLLTSLMATSLASSLSATEDMEKWLRPSEVPQPKDNKITPKRVELGKLLYFDTRLSSTGKVSCATCHHPKRGWTDLEAVSKAVGINGERGPRNSPTVMNSAYQKHQFWDGRARTLEQQALGPIEADVEMNMPLEVLIPKLNKIQGYKKLFAKAYPQSKGEITEKYLAKAIASFERTAVSGNTPFDKYIKGDKKAISAEAKEGFKIFKGKANCVSCHEGFNFSDGSFHNLGMTDGQLAGKDVGRYAVKRRAAWYGVFKTPTLRDVAISHPYMHDGSVKSLEEASRICNEGKFPHVKNFSTQVQNKDLTDDDYTKMVSFLKTLTTENKTKIPTNFPQ